MLDARLNKRNQQLLDTQNNLVKARVHLTRLQKKQASAETLLAANLRASYMDGQPTFVGVVLDSNGFADMIDRFEYLRRISRRNASVLGATQDARVQVQGETVALKKLHTTYAGLAKDAAADRDTGRRAAHRAAQPRGGAAAGPHGHRGQAGLGAGQDRRDPAPPGGGRPRGPRRGQRLDPGPAREPDGGAAAGTSSRASSPPRTRSPARRTSGAAATAASPAAMTARARSATRSPPAACSPARSTRPASRAGASPAPAAASRSTRTPATPT